MVQFLNYTLVFIVVLFCLGLVGFETAKSCNVAQADLKIVMVVLLFLPSSRIKSL